MCEFSLQVSVQASTQNFFAEIAQSASFVKGFPKCYDMLNSNNWK